jgi:hypothetical protein
MKTQVGMWIDHREANIVFLSPAGERTRQIKSNVEKQLRRSGDSPSNERYETQMVPASGRRERGYMGHLANYYEEVFFPLMVLTPSLSSAREKRKGNCVNNSRRGILAKG